jgi:hypothetical protein
MPDECKTFVCHTIEEGEIKGTPMRAFGFRHD